MKGVSVLFACFTMLAAVPVLAEEPLKLEDENARISYSVGYQVGGDFNTQGVAIDLDVLARGAADAIAGAEPLMTPQEMRKELTDLQKEVTDARKARAAKLAAEQREAGKAFLESNKTKVGVEVTESGLQYRIIEPGTGRQPGPTDQVTVNYRGTRIDGTEFDSSYKRGKPAQFRLDRVIKGWTEGLQLLKEGGKAQLFVPHELAYGERGRLGNQVLIFDVELISVGEARTDEQAQGEEKAGASDQGG
jgi:FKBP-type peptidyl-prolyl cis-trans isomerase FklB